MQTSQHENSDASDQHPGPGFRRASDVSQGNICLCRELQQFRLSDACLAAVEARIRVLFSGLPYQKNIGTIIRQYALRPSPKAWVPAVTLLSSNVNWQRL